MVELLNRPRCYNFEKCGNIASALLMRRWLCLDCYKKASDRMEELKEKAIFEE
jgi:hypothetical protein